MVQPRKLDEDERKQLNLAPVPAVAPHQPRRLTDDELDELDRQFARQNQLRESVQSGPAGGLRRAFDPVIATMQGNFQNLGRGGHNSLLQALTNFGSPGGATQEPETGLGFLSQGQRLPDLRSGLGRQQAEGFIAENRRQASLTEDLLEAISDEAPKRAFGGDVMTFLAEAVLSGPQFSNVNRTRQTIGRMIQEGATGATFGALTVQADDSLKTTAVATGLLTGAITPLMFDRLARRMELHPKDRQLVLDRLRAEKMFQQQGFLTLGELTGAQSALKTESMLDNIVFIGLGRKRREQKNAMIDIADSLVRQISGGQQGTNREIVTRLAKNLERRFDNNMKLVQQKFDETARILDDLSPGAVGQVKPAKMVAEAEKLLDRELSKLPSEQNASFIRRLQKVINNPPVTFKGARETASSLAESARIARTKASKAEINKTVAGAEERLLAAFMDDIERWAFQTSGGRGDNAAYRTWLEAKDLFKNRILPFYKAEGPIADAAQGRLSNQSLDDLVGSFFRADKPLRSRQNMQLLFRSDQNAVKFLVLRDAMVRSTEAGQLNPAKFSDELRKLSAAFSETDVSGQRAVRKLFGPTQSELIDGFILLAESAPRASTNAGKQALGTMIATGSIGGAANFAGAATGGSIFATILGARWLLTSQSGRKFATIAAELQGTPNEKRKIGALVKEAERAFTRWLEIEMSKQAENVQTAQDFLGPGSFGVL